MLTNLDFSFYNWDVITGFLAKGLYFSLFLTVVATLGGILFGTLLALMRLSGKKWLDAPAAIYVNGMRSIPLVMVILWFFLLVPASFYAAFGSVGSNYRSEISAPIGRPMMKGTSRKNHRITITSGMLRMPLT